MAEVLAVALLLLLDTDMGMHVGLSNVLKGGYDLYSCSREVIAKLCTVAIVRLLRRFVQLQPRGYRHASYSCNCVVIAIALFQALHACGYVERLLR